MTPPALELTRPADLAYLPELLSAVTNMARNAGLDSARVGSVELAMEEALVNVIEHAYKGARGDVTVRATCSAEGNLMVLIEDNGPAFNPLESPEPDLNVDIADRRIGGLGVHFIKSLADEVDYRRETNRNILSFQFRAGSTPVSGI